MFGLEKRYGQPEKSKNKLDLKFIKWTYGWNKKRRNVVLSMLELIKDKKVLIIKEPKKLDIISLLK